MPLTHIKRYERPDDLQTAWELLVDGGQAVRVLGGGTDLVVNCPREVSTLVDLAGLDLRFLEEADDGSIRIGAMTTFTELLELPALAEHTGGILAEMLVQVGSVLHRNSATIGGHLSRGRLSDVTPVLLALDAEVTFTNGTSHTMPIETYYAEQRNRTPHIVTEVRLPAARPSSAGAFERFTRTAFDHALVNCACRIDLAGGTVAQARVVVGQTAALGRRVPPAEAALAGGPLDGDSIAAAAAAAQETVETSGDWSAGAAYRSHLIGVLVGRSLATVARRLEGGAA